MNCHIPHSKLPFPPAVALFLAALAVLHAADAPKQKPNIIIILADDLGYGDVQSYNPERGKIPTPGIDKFAAQGMRFTDGHSSSAVCTPSRYSLLTGRYSWRSRLQHGILGLFKEPLIAPDRMTIGTLAKQQGYRTAAIGKWHLGMDWPFSQEQRKFLVGPTKAGQPDEPTPEHLAAWQAVFTKPISGGPTARGFDTFFGTDAPNFPPFCFIENNRTLGVPSEFLPRQLKDGSLACSPGPALKGWKLEDILPTVGERAAQFITERAAKAEPFLLYLPLTSPHTPHAVSDTWRNKSGLNTYADFVMETDAIISRVLDALDKSGAEKNTLVILTSDNGCAPHGAELEAKGHYPSGPLRGYKSDAWEGGHRIPFIVRWPGVVKPGSVSSQLVSQVDLFATFAEILGAKLPENAAEDSFSLLPLFKGVDRPVRENVVCTSHGGVPALRLGSWKYIADPGSGGWGKGGDSSQPVQLFNLADDLGETQNLAAAMPEKVAEMKALLEKLITHGRSTPGVSQKNDVAVVRYPREPAKKDGTKKTATKPTTSEPRD
ncbi:MAG: arylsulfatase [Opitutaceae bacterium]